MPSLPKHIYKALQNGQISIGTECFPPDEEEQFSVRLLSDYYEALKQELGDDIQSLKRQLTKDLATCQKLEHKGGNRETLEKCCSDIVVKLFQIPNDTLIMDLHIVEKVSTGDCRILPEKTEGFTFDSIADLEGLTDEVYKRRMLNALIAGCANHYSFELGNYANEIYTCNPQLPSLYYNISLINQYLLYTEKDIYPQESGGCDGGRVDVRVDGVNLPSINAEGIIMPVLLEETIKGLLELAISHGLPKEREKAVYVMGKADFKLAEQWDARLGGPLWGCFEDAFDSIDTSAIEVGLSFLFMTLSQLPTDLFRGFLREIFGHTKEGQKMLQALSSDILYKRGRDEFNSHLEKQNGEQELFGDDEYYSPEELIQDDIDRP